MDAMSIAAYNEARLGRRRVAQIVNRWATPGLETDLFNFATSNNSSAAVLSPADFSAGVLKTVIAITGGGVLKLLSVLKGNSTVKTVRIRVTIDSVVVFDSTTINSGRPTGGMQAVGFMSGTNVMYEHVPFYESLLVEVASSVTEASGPAIAYVYELAP